MPVICVEVDMDVDVSESQGGFMSKKFMVAVMIVAGHTAIMGTVCARADVHYNDGATHTLSGNYGAGFSVYVGETISSGVVVQGINTNIGNVFNYRGSTATVTAGYVGYVGSNIFDGLGGTVRVTGGQVGFLSGAGLSMLFPSGGTVSGAAVRDSSKIFATGAAYLGTLDAYGNGNADINGSSVVIPTMTMHDSSTASIRAGILGAVYAGDNSVVSISGGRTSDARESGNGRINYSGGVLGPNTVYLTDNSIFNVVGSSLSVGDAVPGIDSVTGLSGNYYQISGTFLNNTSFATRFFDTTGGREFGSSALTTNIYFNNQPFTKAVVPEPGTLALCLPCVLGVIGILRKKK